MLRVKVNSGSAFRGLNRLAGNLNGHASHQLQELAEDILRLSNEHCPYETGELRNSGRVRMRSPQYPRGTTVAKVQGATSSGGGTVNEQDDFIGRSQNNPFYQAIVSYQRIAPWRQGIFDVAVFTHEDLQRGVKANTTGKYLENSFNRYAPQLRGRMRKAISDAILESVR